MALCALLQMLKKMLSESHASVLYSNIWKFISKAEARDKVGRIMQYGCRGLQGLLSHCPDTFPLQVYKPVIAEVQTTLAWARRTHRWGKELPHIPTLGKAITNGDVLQAAQSMVLITFLIQDHIYWLLKVGILKFESYTAIQWHRRNLRFITLSHVLNFSLCLRDNIRAEKKIEKLGANPDAKKLDEIQLEIYDNKRMMLRYVLTFFQMLHVSGAKAMDDSYIGLFGMISSYIDASKQWPTPFRGLLAPPPNP